MKKGGTNEKKTIKKIFGRQLYFFIFSQPSVSNFVRRNLVSGIQNNLSLFDPLTRRGAARLFQCGGGRVWGEWGRGRGHEICQVLQLLLLHPVAPLVPQQRPPFLRPLLQPHLQNPAAQLHQVCTTTTTTTTAPL